MIVSALLTSVGINTALCVLFFTCYSILRKQPSNYKVYVPRLLAEGISKRKKRFNLERLIPSPDWVAKAWTLSEEELFSLAGLDGVVFIRTITFCLKIFTFAGIIGILVLLPVNCWANQMQEFDVTDFADNSLDVFTISNINSGSNWLWVHFCAVYIVTGFICLLLHHEYKYIASKRISHFHSSKPQPHQFTILVRSIPTSSSCSVSESVESFFKEFYPSTYLSHVVIRHTSKIRSLLEARAAFVFFKSRYGAATASHMQLSVNPTQWITEPVPEPRDVYWPFFFESFMRRWISKLLAIVATTFFTISFLIPVVIVQGLVNLNQLEVLFPSLTSILTIKFVTQIITGYLPSLILQLFLKVVPPVMRLISSIQGYISNSNIEISACNKVLSCTIWNVFLATVFSGSVLTQLSLILDLKSIPWKLAVSVPAQASFFITYVVTQGWTSVLSELFRIIPLICSLISKPFTSPEHEIDVPSIPYHRDVPRVLFFGLLGITYFFLAPLILPFLLAYFCLAYIIYRNQFINVYAPKYETAGKYWPIVHNTMIFSLVLMQVIAMGSFALKKLKPASAWMLPLPVLTLLFNEYCRKRFLPVFIAYSVERIYKQVKTKIPLLTEELLLNVAMHQDKKTKSFEREDGEQEKTKRI
ncbi:hypothetical protein TanjilG_28028 [Lupinus angustifolius]|uniref:CSC1/OSCA1-like 7TM region domain-containing protein n=1 Tax=Lupinus angustifolius TaxID=3871 RepID=A0A4P1RGG4_LUPAN|nr:hypothetical protein TanjilG_28028 [Lupinus angustifolius]